MQDIRLFTSQPKANFYSELFLHLDTDCLQSVMAATGRKGYDKAALLWCVHEYAQTKAYIEQQLAYAGHSSAIFSEDAMKQIFDFSSGVPRLINRACTQSLIYA